MIYLNGRLVAPAEAWIDPADRGFLLGDGLFETLRSYGGRLPARTQHLERLQAGAAELGIPWPADNLEGAVRETLAANDLAERDAAMRITLSRGPGPRGLLPPEEPRPTLMITAAPLNPAPPEPAAAIIASTRRNEHSPLSRLKTLNYLDNVLARQEAAAQGADEAILLNTAGHLACASAANLFLVRGRRLFTPPVSDGVLPGITRATVLTAAPELDLAVAEVPLDVTQLREAEEAFLTNSLIGIRALTRLNDRPLGDGAPGPVTRRLSEALQERLG